jgi:hypothetical protein
MCSFDEADSGTNSEVLGFIPVRCRNVCGMFVERLLLSVLTLLQLPDLLADGNNITSRAPSFVWSMRTFVLAVVSTYTEPWSMFEQMIGSNKR